MLEGRVDKSTKGSSVLGSRLVGLTWTLGSSLLVSSMVGLDT
jgi:hypothetical protein